MSFFGLAENPGDDQGDERVGHIQVIDLADRPAGTLVHLDPSYKLTVVVSHNTLFAKYPSSLVCGEAKAL